MFDVIVIGAGAIGMATAHYLSKLQVKTMLIEQLTCPNTRGSSSGQSRELSYVARGDGCLQHLPKHHQFHNHLVSVALQEWNNLEELSDKTLLMKSKKISIRKTKSSGLHTATRTKIIKGVKSCQLLHEVDAWIIKSGKSLQVLRENFLQYGGVLMEQEQVVDIQPIHDQKVEVQTSKGLYTGKQIIVTCGAWTNKILRPLEIQLPLKITRHQVAYFKATRFPLYEYESGFPVVILEEGKSPITFTPIYEYPGLMKVHTEDGLKVDDADRRDRMMTTCEHERAVLRRIEEAVKSNFKHLDCEPSIVETAISCKIEDSSYVIDRHPDYENVIIACGFGVEGFGIAPAIARMLATLVLNPQDTNNDDRDGGGDACCLNAVDLKIFSELSLARFPAAKLTESL